MTVLSMPTFSKSAGPAQLSRIFSQTPNQLQRAKRLKMLFQWPKLLGKQRHCAPQRKIHSAASTNWRQATSQLIRMPTIFFKLASIYLRPPESGDEFGMGNRLIHKDFII